MGFARLPPPCIAMVASPDTQETPPIVHFCMWRSINHPSRMFFAASTVSLRLPIRNNLAPEIVQDWWSGALRLPAFQKYEDEYEHSP